MAWHFHFRYLFSYSHLSSLEHGGGHAFRDTYESTPGTDRYSRAFTANPINKRLCARTGWSKNAYATYAMQIDHLCNMIMMIVRLKERRSKASRASRAHSHPEFWGLDDDSIVGSHSQNLS
jgi:hypothetical protein